MATPSIVQSAFNDSGFNAPYNVVLPSAPTEGNTLVAFLWQRNFVGTPSSSWTPTDISGGTWALDAAGNGYAGSQYGGPGGAARMVAYSRPVGASESATITVTPGSGVTACMVVEVAGAVDQVITSDNVTLVSTDNHDMSAAVTVPSLMLVAWGMQRTEYAPADSVAADVGVTELRDARPPSNASPHCWVAWRATDGPGTLTVGGTPAFNPHLNKWGVFSVAYTFEGTAAPVEPQIDITINSVEFTGLLSKELRVELNGTGYVHFSISRGDPQATEANLARGNLIQVTIPEIHSGVLFEAFLETGDFDLLSSEEQGGQELRFAGPGTLAVLRRSVVAYEEYLDGTGQWKPNKGRVVFADGVTEGHIVNKLIREAQAAGRPSDPIPMVTKTFDSDDDSNGNPWNDEALEGSWKVPMGAVLYDEVIRLVRAGLLSVEMAPGFMLNLYRARGYTRTGSSFGAGVVRFVAGVNIADELVRGMAGRDFATHAYIRYEDGWTDAAKLSGSFPYEQEIFVEAGETDHAATARRTARGEMGWRETVQESLLLSHIVPWPGDGPDDDAGIYLPGPTWSDHGRYWLGDLVTVHTGTGEHDYENATHRVYAITLREDATGHLAPPVLELNAPYLSADAAASGLSASPIAGSITGGGTKTVKVDLTAYQQEAEKGQPDGYASLDGDGLVPVDELPVGTAGDEVAAGDHAHTLDALADVDMTGKADGDVPTWDAATSSWIPSVPGGSFSGDAGDVPADATGYANSSGTDVQAILDDFDTAISAAASGGVLNNHSATTAPTVSDDSSDGYAVGSIWIDVTADEAYICVDASPGAAVWNPFEQAGASPAMNARIYGVNGGGNSSGQWATANKAVFVPIVVLEDCTLYRFYYITGGTTSTAANVDIGLYDESGALVVSTGATAYTTGNNNDFVAIDVADTPIAAGLYYLAFVCSVASGNTQFRRLDQGGNTLGALGYYVQSSALPLPATGSWSIPTSESIGPVCGFTARSEIA